MPEVDLTNVLAFEKPDRSEGQVPAADGQVHLISLRDRLVHGVATVFAENLGSAQDNLLAMADRASSLGAQNLYLAAQSFLTQRGQELLQRFRSAFLRSFDDSMARSGRTPAGPSLDEAGELSLVGEADFERDLSVGKLSSRATYNCSQQLTALDRRMAVLLRVQRIIQDENPLHPKALFAAFLEAGRELEVGDQVGIVLLQEFECQIETKLPSAYQDLNRYLIDQGILPKIPLGLEQPARHLGPAASGVQGVEPAPTNTDDIFAELASRLQGPATSAMWGTPVMQTGHSQPVSHRPAQMIEALTGLQKGVSHDRGLSGIDPLQLDSGTSSILRQIRSAPMIGLSHPLDAVTIDIVAMLFDLIFDDPDVPDALRAQIGRLQIPVLKVALMDKGFFSNKQHPARRLLDTIASSAVGWSKDGESRLLAKLTSIVDALIGGFESDVGIFSAQCERLDDFLADEEERARGNAGRLVEDLERRERAELAPRVVAEEIRRRTSGRDLPTPITDFLNKQWRLVLTRVLVEIGERSPVWVEGLQTMEDLVWSVTPKRGMEERQRLLLVLPELLQRLRTGLASVETEGWDEFLAELIRHHVEAVRADLQEDDKVLGTKITELAMQASPATEGAEEPLGAAGELGSFEKADEEESNESAPEPVDQYRRAAQEIALGSWVEFSSARGNRRTLRLNWISGFGGVCLFTDRQGEDALTLPTARLADRLREGSARLLSGDRLTERAVAHLLDKTRDGQVPVPG
ncbi:MAG: DUF1631 domain-containing protein [Pseudomonadota bacterium]|nr:DUF1631 domain-containing protein [Pseudomonadota bacterium]